MPRLHALELLLDDASAARVRASWQSLRDAGLPSLMDHSGATNAPHVTVVSAPVIPAEAMALATARLGALLPITVRPAGLVLLGGARLTVARVVDVEDDVVRAVLDVRAAVPGRQHPGWLPHVSLTRRVPRADVHRVVDAVDHDDVTLALSELRWWDPDRGTVTRLT